MRELKSLLVLLVLSAVAACPFGCAERGTMQGAATDLLRDGEYVILDTRTDNFDFPAAKAQPEDALARYPDLDCMVGLFTYNPPYILEALKSANMLGEVKVVAFDEDDASLQAIIDGNCVGTIVQHPYRYGYESVRILAGLARGDQSVLPENGFLDIPARKITNGNVTEFWDELRRLMQTDDGEGAEPDTVNRGSAADRPTVAFVTNGIAAFWVIAEKGAQDAAREFDVNLEVRMPTPDGPVAVQKRMLEELLTMGMDGIAVSPINPENQADILNTVAERTILITHDSDAPDSKRLCYVGMSNYQAGRMCGELVKEAMPDGGTVMIFVGRLEQLNARHRRQGLIDELLDRSHDPDRFDEPGKILTKST